MGGDIQKHFEAWLVVSPMFLQSCSNIYILLILQVLYELYARNVHYFDFSKILPLKLVRQNVI